jgi:hypothetical protein
VEVWEHYLYLNGSTHSDMGFVSSERLDPFDDILCASETIRIESRNTSSLMWRAQFE